MAHYCHKCLNEVEFIVNVGFKVGRLDTCVHCGVYLHCCKCCQYYDPGRHNDCEIPDADFIRDREEANFCNSYRIKDWPEGEAPEKDDTVEKAKAQLDNMFKNLK